MIAVSGSQSRLLAVGLLGLVLAALVAAIVVPAAVLHRHYDARIEDFVDKLQRYRRVAAQRPEWQRAVENLTTRNSSRFVLKNQAANLAGAELQDLVRTAIESNGGKIITIQSAQPRDEGRFRQVGLAVQMFGNAGSVQRILYALETHVPYVFIDNISLRATAFRGYRPNAGVEPEISVQMDVSSFAPIPAAERK